MAKMNETSPLTSNALLGTQNVQINNPAQNNIQTNPPNPAQIGSSTNVNPNMQPIVANEVNYVPLTGLNRNSSFGPQE